MDDDDDDDDDDDSDADESLFGLGEWFEDLFTGTIVGYQPLVGEMV